MAGATGDFRDQYAKSTDGVIKLLQQNKSVMTGEVLWAGVVAQDPDSATVIVATTGTVAEHADRRQADGPQLPAPAAARLREGQVAHQRPAVRAMTRQNPRAAVVLAHPDLPPAPGGRAGERRPRRRRPARRPARSRRCRATAGREPRRADEPGRSRRASLEPSAVEAPRRARRRRAAETRRRDRAAGLAALFDSRRATTVLVGLVAVLALVAGGLFAWDAAAAATTTAEAVRSSRC